MVEVSIIVSIIALLVSAVLFLIGYFRGKKSEQVRISREIWSGILTQNRIIHEWMFDKDIQSKESRTKLKRAQYLLKNDLDYFVFFVEKREIKATDILEFYRKRVSDVYNTITNVCKLHPDVKEYNETEEILRLIERYNEWTKNLRSN